MKKLPYVPIVGLILKVSQEPDCCSSLITLRTEEGIANIQVSLDTKVIDNLRLRPGLRTAAFYDASLPVPLVYPPLYQAKIITRLDREEEIVLDYFDSDLTALDGSLKLVPGRETEIETINGQSFPLQHSESDASGLLLRDDQKPSASGESLQDYRNPLQRKLLGPYRPDPDPHIVDDPGALLKQNRTELLLGFGQNFPDSFLRKVFKRLLIKHADPFFQAVFVLLRSRTVKEKGVSNPKAALLHQRRIFPDGGEVKCTKIGKSPGLEPFFQSAVHLLGAAFSPEFTDQLPSGFQLPEKIFQHLFLEGGVNPMEDRIGKNHVCFFFQLKVHRVSLTEFQLRILAPCQSQHLGRIVDSQNMKSLLGKLLRQSAVTASQIHRELAASSGNQIQHVFPVSMYKGKMSPIRFCLPGYIHEECLLQLPCCPSWCPQESPWCPQEPP